MIKIVLLLAMVGQLMDSRNEDVIQRLIPRVQDDQVQSALDGDLFVYRHKEIPPAYQIDTRGNLLGLHSPAYNISDGGGEPHGNANKEFPWGKGFGLDSARNVKVAFLISLPLKEDGTRWPIAYQIPRNWPLGFATWVFPKRTRVFEFLYQVHDKASWPFELRMREKEQNSWRMDVFRPVKDADEYYEILHAWFEAPRPYYPVAAGRSGPPVKTRASKRAQTLTVARREKLPAIPKDLVAEILFGRPWPSVGEAKYWSASDKEDYCFSPTTDSSPHIVPAGYDAHYVSVDQVSCMECHRTVNHAAREFHGVRDWYGRVRGSDLIFSFHPFSPSSISYTGIPKKMNVNRKLVDAGIIEKFERSKHPASMYVRTKVTRIALNTESDPRRSDQSRPSRRRPKP